MTNLGFWACDRKDQGRATPMKKLWNAAEGDKHSEVEASFHTSFKVNALESHFPATADLAMEKDSPPLTPTLYIKGILLLPWSSGRNIAGDEKAEREAPGNYHCPILFNIFFVRNWCLPGQIEHIRNQREHQSLVPHFQISNLSLSWACFFSDNL